MWFMDEAIAKSENKLPFNADSINKGVFIMRALNNSFRQQLIKLQHQNGPMNVKSIYKKLKVEQALVSAHLAILRQQKFVKTERKVKEVHYSINYERFSQLEQWTKVLLQ
jgi:predicted transcriptional regulator